MTVGEIVARHHQAADVFLQYDIDFCCGGKKTLGKVCQDRNIEIGELLRKLENLDEGTTSQPPSPATMPIDALADYIEAKHHRYVREQIPVISVYTHKIASVHAERHPELKILERQFQLLAEDLLEHLKKEESILFPYIRNLAQQQPTMLPSAEAPIQVMEHEHEYAGALLENMRQITNGYEVPEDACTKYKITFTKLQEFEQDLHWHIHLENNILFPSVIQEENKQQKDRQNRLN